MKSGIYKITNIITNKCYIGSSCNIMKRKYNHFSSLKHNRHCNKHLQSSYNKYTKDNFIFEIIEECSKNDLITREQYYIDTIKPEYNLCKIADRPTGLKHTEEYKKHMSIHMKRIRKTDRFKNSNFSSAKFDESKIKQIVEDIKHPYTTGYIVSKHNISRRTFHSIVKGDIWKDITKYITEEDRYNLRLLNRKSSYKNKPSKVTFEDINDLKKQGYNITNIAKKLNVCRDTIYNVLNKHHELSPKI